MKIALIGPPNSGKSTIFNAVAGYKALSSNFAGTTVHYTESRVRLNGLVADIVDLPGCYCLSSGYEIEKMVRDYLSSGKVDVLINILDASQLERGLPLTLELMEYNTPIILGLNMLDEAEHKGLSVDSGQLSEILSAPVIPTIASKNQGVKELFNEVRRTLHRNDISSPTSPSFQREVEQILQELSKEIESVHFKNTPFSNRFIAAKLLEGDEEYTSQLESFSQNGLLNKTAGYQKKLAEIRGRPADSVMIMERNALAQDIAHRIVEFHTPRLGWRDRLDNLLMHPFWGYGALILILVGLFYAVYGIGASLEPLLLQSFQSLQSVLATQFDTQGVLYVILHSGLSGISGGVAIVLPYLLPFLLLLTLLEDTGYLPRIAFLMDSFMHRIGLHGTAVMPAILGYGCSVPAVMATRILPERRDKIIAATLATLVPCSARNVIILSLVAYYLGVPAALGIYLLNIIVIGTSGRILSGLMPRVTPGMIMEIPSYQLPSVSAVVRKIWFRMKEFIIIAMPLLIAGSILLGIAEFFQLEQTINAMISPLTLALGLPAAVGTTLIFGVLRKELALIMLIQALGTAEILTVLSAGQIMTFTVFITFYIPCLATLAVLIRELGIRWALLISLITLGLATTLAIITRLGFVIF